MCWIHVFAAALSTTFISPVKNYLSWSKPSGVSWTRRKKQLGQKSDVLPFLSLALLCLLGPRALLYMLSLPAQTHSPTQGCAHGTSSCPPLPGLTAAGPFVIGKALYRLKTQTPSAGRGGVEPCFHQSSDLFLWVPAGGCPMRPCLCVTGMSWEEHSSSVSSVISLPEEELWGPLQWRGLGTA